MDVAEGGCAPLEVNPGGLGLLSQRLLLPTNVLYMCPYGIPVKDMARSSIYKRRKHIPD